MNPLISLKFMGINLCHFIKDVKSLIMSTILFSGQGNGRNNDTDHY